MTDKPTDEEIIMLAVELGVSVRTGKGAVKLARAVLAKWGTPQPAPATQQPEGDVVAYLDVGASGYLDLGAALSEDALQQLPKGRHALVIAGTYGIDGYVAAPQPSPKAQAADSVPAVEREQERTAFKDAHQHLELYEVPDAWGRPMFKHSHVEASWLGWIARASHGQAPAPTHEQIAAYLESTGAYVTNDATREAAIAEAIDTDRAKRGQAPATAHADSVTEPAGVEEGDIDAVALARYKVVPAHESMIHRFAVVAGDGKRQLYLGREIECANMARKFAGAFLDGAFYQSNIAPTPPAQAADSVQEDAARYRWLAASCRSTSEHWGGRWSIVVEGPAPKSHDSEDDFDAAIDAGRKQGANHD